jgi:hypothetical protein
VERNTSDFRSESHRVFNIDTIKVFPAGNSKVNWEERKRIIFKKEKPYTNFPEIVELAKKPPYKSLVTFKPTRIVDFYAEPTERDWPENKVDYIRSKARQLSLFQTPDELIREFNFVQKLPYVFKYKFFDDEGKEHNLIIEDWEAGTLYLHCLENAQGDEGKALEKVREKYWDDFSTKDLYFFLGTRMSDHHLAPSPFSIVGVFYPPVDRQGNLF